MLKKIPIVKLLLKRNLVKKLKQGSPWIYKESIDVQEQTKLSLAKLIYKKQVVAWGLYTPNSPLSFRQLVIGDKYKSQWLEERILRAIELRKSLLNSSSTNCLRLIYGEADLIPGLIVDVYNSTLVFQLDDPSFGAFYDLEKIAEFIQSKLQTQFAFFKSRHDQKTDSRDLIGESPRKIEIMENSVRFSVDIENGQKTGFFIDQRENREYVRGISEGKKVLNLFSYTGGFSLYAGAGKAQKVVSVDIAKPATANTTYNWELNPELNSMENEELAQNVFDYLDELQENFDLIIVDPPSFSNTETNKESALGAYKKVFVKAIKHLNPSGDICFSSCSSHIDMEQFLELVQECLSTAKKRAQVLRSASAGSDHPFLLPGYEMRYLKFVHCKLYS
ncbi:MAG: class I SAM-dependent rRNA methyltransferase [Bdellovibrionales bacterium]